jgi:hypothetical protein
MTLRRITVVLDGDSTPAWQARALSLLTESPVLDIVEVRTVGPPHRGLASRLHAAAERHLFSLGAHALAPVTVNRLTIEQPVVTEPAMEQPVASGPAMEQPVVSGRARQQPVVSGPAMEQPVVSGRARQQPVASGPARLIVWLAERPAPEDECDVLYLRHGGLAEPAEDAFTRAVMDGVPCVQTEVLLQRADCTVVVERTLSGVRPFSATLSYNLALWKAAAMIRRAAERAPGWNLPAPSSRPSAPAPSTAALIAHSASTWPRALATRVLFRRPWSVRVRRRGTEPTVGWSGDEGLVRWRSGHVYADPFLFEREGRHHLFCEEIPLGAERAVISHTELDLDEIADPPTPILQQSYHLSYPFVFTHENSVFMVPETRAVRRVELYRAVEFPYEWRLETVLLDDVNASDATLLFHGDRLWMFTALAAPGASVLDELHLFWAHELQGPWHPHPHNPVVSDVRCARPAGAVLEWDARLVRPGQDGSFRYGGAISFRQIDVLSPSDYAEHEIARLGPGDLGDARATHTYTAGKRFEAVDLRKRELRVRSPWRRR